MGLTSRSVDTELPSLVFSQNLKRQPYLSTPQNKFPFLLWRILCSSDPQVVVVLSSWVVEGFGSIYSFISNFVCSSLLVYWGGGCEAAKKERKHRRPELNFSKEKCPRVKPASWPWHPDPLIQAIWCLVAIIWWWSKGRDAVHTLHLLVTASHVRGQGRLSPCTQNMYSDSPILCILPSDPEKSVAYS